MITKQAMCEERIQNVAAGESWNSRMAMQRAIIDIGYVSCGASNHVFFFQS